MTPEQRAEFGSRVSYGASGSGNHETAEHATEESHNVAEHHATEEPEIVNVEHENAHVEDEVQIVGISDETMDDGLDGYHRTTGNKRTRSLCGRCGS